MIRRRRFARQESNHLDEEEGDKMGIWETDMSVPPSSSNDNVDGRWVSYVFKVL